MSQKSTKNNYKENFLNILAEVEDTYYKSQEISTIRRFIEEYNPTNDFLKICFSRSGGNGIEFKDRNQDFRDKIAIYICLNTDVTVSPLLLSDLIQETGKASRDSWGAPEYLFLLSERLLKETGGKYIETFGEMLFSNMDTYGACIGIDFKNIDILGILDELKRKEQKDKLILDLIEYFEAQL
ncbi:hypothetical protein SAMN02745163_02459 [Clostridium cavendishii DSM 21758]|uniref:Uncharacterized protein n=1 Tax=Clostridium cavendishii DSM 21758 TaxID=1121302 RepID=A0A1M6LQY9_9CLOT|nr:hypothetical protein [Clostridium cavendishii]SHJ73492.1 hypothetical protein SAMN02745163_02459 [Clostridium cavendishii DSM 21758]